MTERKSAHRAGKQRATRSSGRSSGGVGVAGRVLQDYAPLAESIEWRLGQGYWSHRGAGAFTSQEVPNAATNDGMGAARAAEVLFASCEAARARNELEPEVLALEAGAGSGLHARILLDRVREKCRAEGRDYYERVTYLAAEATAVMVRDLAERGVFATHAARVRVGTLDALAAERFGVGMGEGAGAGTGTGTGTGMGASEGAGDALPLGGRVRAVFGNYLLDVMPYAAVRVRNGRLEELRVRTTLAPGPGVDLARARELCARGDAEALQVLGEALPRMAPRYKFVPVRFDELPEGEALARFVGDVLEPPPKPGWVDFTHSYGALRALDSLLRTLRPDGFVLFNDYGVVTPDEYDEPRVHQRFGGSTAMGVNFPQVEHFLARVRTPKALWSEPPGDADHPLHARLATLSPAPEVHRVFRTQFDRAGYRTVADLLFAGRAASARKKAALAVKNFRAASDMAPYNWAALHALGRALATVAGDPAAALPVLERALAINPVSAPEVWNDYGEALAALGRDEEAFTAWRRAHASDAGNARALAHLAEAWLARGDAARALQCVGRALGADRDGALEKSLLRTQARALAVVRAARARE